MSTHSSQVAQLSEQQGTSRPCNGGVSVPLMKSCCVPGDGTVPITIPVYSPFYQGTQLLSGSAGIIPQQQYVFASPTGMNKVVCHGQAVPQQQPLYQIQTDVFTNQQQQNVNADEPINVTHYIWKQTEEQTRPIKHQGTFAKLRTLFNWQDSNSVFGDETQNEQAAKVSDELGSQQGGDNEQVQKIKKQQPSGFFNSCCMNVAQLPTFENCASSVCNINRYCKLNTVQGEEECVDEKANTTRENSITSVNSLTGKQAETIVSQQSSESQHTVVAQENTNLQNAFQQCANRSVPESFQQASIHSQHGMIPQSSICSNHDLVNHVVVSPLNALSQQPSIQVGGSNASSIPSVRRASFVDNTQTPFCFNMCYPRTVSNQFESVVPVNSFQNPPSIPVNNAAVGCFGMCCGGAANNFTTLASQGTMGLRNLFTMNPVSQRSIISNQSVPVEQLSRQMSAMSVNPTQEVVSDIAQEQILINDTVVVDRNGRNVRKSAMKPKTFKLHAIEIHQFVPIQNNAVSPFVETLSGMNQAGTPIFHHGYGIQHPNSFFNPNTTGHIAPVIKDVMQGVTNPKIPHMYSVDSSHSCQAVRLPTEESQVTPREEVNEAPVEQEQAGESQRE
ncbi:hypothetical protein, conserved [Babesia bigemina]|uniref:Uncharacterized protein n=1 Tax=Babesia bigemina TaxID=5866 RepID=A0A061D6I6_BABBI|nr:hypothetical protein, conserved [Babesia bigemina]CDR96168.1 hypothetical protein, conserved [Babesia bigemina]|eukprot:XP_012768354.1 hypothetical protein, conserved [Babesia bigemina]